MDEIKIIKEDLFNHFASQKFAENKFCNVESKVAHLIKKISQAKIQIIIFFFILWVTQLGAIFAFLKFFIKQ